MFPHGMTTNLMIHWNRLVLAKVVMGEMEFGPLHGPPDDPHFIEECKRLDLCVRVCSGIYMMIVFEE